jgi:hypothetical protein
MGSMANRAAVPLCIYGVTAIWCWLTPYKFALDGETFVINAFPTGALAVASVALAIVHRALALRGQTVVAVAGAWAVTTMSMIVAVAVSHLLPPSMASAFTILLALTMAGTACALAVLAWQLARRRLAADAHVIVRGLVVLGVAGLAYNFGEMTLRQAGVLAATKGLEQMAAVTAGLTVDVGLNSAVVLLGAVSHGVLSGFRSWQSAA